MSIFLLKVIATMVGVFIFGTIIFTIWWLNKFFNISEVLGGLIAIIIGGMLCFCVGAIVLDFFGVIPLDVLGLK